MGKLDHIPELTDASAFFQWKAHVKLSLGRDGVYNHVSERTDPLSFADFASVCPKPASPASPTEAERTAVMTWLQDDAVAKDILCRRLSLSVLRLVPETDTTTARDVWRLLHKRFDHVEASQHLLRARLWQLQMKDAHDASRYLGEHASIRRNLLRMGAPYSDSDAIVLLLNGLPRTGTWPTFRLMSQRSCGTSAFSSSTATTSDTSTSASTAAAVASFTSAPLSTGSTTFENISTEIAAEAYRLFLDTSPFVAVGTASSRSL